MRFRLRILGVPALVDFEPLYTTCRAETVARFVAERYALPLPLDCRMLNRGFNDVYLIVTATDERYVFRLSHHRARRRGR